MTDFPENLIQNFMKIRRVGAELFGVERERERERWTDGYDEAKNRF